MTAHGGTLLNREAAAIAEQVFGKKTNISDHLLDILRLDDNRQPTDLRLLAVAHRQALDERAFGMQGRAVPPDNHDFQE